MSEFSEKLSKYIDICGIRQKELVFVSGFDRATISKIMSGSRLPKNNNKMKRLIEVLNITADEYTELWNLYMLESQGKENYELYMAVMKLISSFNSTSSFPINIKSNQKITDIVSVNGSTDVNYLIRIFIENEAVKENGYIKVIMQPECGQLMDSLRTGFKISSDLRVDHLVCLDNGADYKGKTYNVRLLQMIVPVFLCNSNVSYNIHYYYDRIESKFNSYSLMPYFIINNEMVINFDSNLEHAVVYSEKAIVEYYNKKAESLMKKCKRIIECDSRKKNFDHFTEVGYPITANDMDVYHMASQPCVGALPIGSMIDKYVCDADKRILNLIKQKNLYNSKNVTAGCATITCYFTKRGVKAIAEEGKIDIIPGCKITDEKDRKEIIRKIIDLTQRGCYRIHIIDTEKFTMPNRMFIEAYDNSKLVISYDVDVFNKNIFINERTIADAVYNYMVRFENDVFVYSVEDTVEYLKRIIGE